MGTSVVTEICPRAKAETVYHCCCSNRRDDSDRVSKLSYGSCIPPKLFIRLDLKLVKFDLKSNGFDTHLHSVIYDDPLSQSRGILEAGTRRTNRLVWSKILICI